MDTQTRRSYGKFRAAGYGAEASLRNAKILAQWEAAESAGLVRLRFEPEPESYFDTYGEPEGYDGVNGRRVSAEQERKELIESIERDGCWWAVSEVFVDGEWVAADSIGMLAGYKDPASPFQNWYVPDLMRSALAHVGQAGEH